MWSRLLLLALLLLPAPALADVKEKVAALAPSGLVLVMDADGNELVAQNADKPFVPASVTKIVTAWLALEVLGGDYRFQTRFYLDDKQGAVRARGRRSLPDLRRAGAARAPLVAAIGKQPLTGIVLDASYYPADLRIPGIEDSNESYDALNSALAVNFNTIYAERRGNERPSPPRSRPRSPRWRSASSGRAGPKGRGRISLSQDPAVSLQYAGELHRRVHRAGRRQRQGQDLDRIRAQGPAAGLRSPPVAHPFGDPRRIAPSARTTTSPTRSSSRSAGTAWAVPSASRNRYRSRARCSPRTTSPTPSISRRARASAAATASRPAASPRCSTFSRPTPTCSGGHDGGANKTGTLDGVRTLAGYANTSRHGQVRFVISLRSNNGAMRFQLLQAIQSAL